MHRGFLCLLVSVSALAQAPQQNPLDMAVQAHWKARTEARFDEAAAKREEARALLAQMPVEARQFGGWVQNVAQLYQGSGMYARAHEVAEASLERTGRLGDAHPTRILLLNMLAGFWQEDRNLLKAVTYWEKAVSALEAAPPASSAGTGVAPVSKAYLSVQGSTGSGRLAVFGNTFSRGGPSSTLSSAYQRLATIYQQLGRPEAVAAVLSKMKNLAGDNNFMLGSFYEGQGKLDEAAAIYQKQLAQAAGDPQQMSGPLQSLANLYQREQRFGDAAATLQQAIASMDASGGPASRSQSQGLRQRLAELLRQAGQTGQADQLYQQMLAESQSRQDPNYSLLLLNYASYLATTKRSDQAETLLSDYMANHPQLEPWQESNFLYARANAARQSGDSDRAAGYERAAQDKQQARSPIPPEQLLLQTLLQKANTAAWGANPEEAFSLTLQAMDAAPRAYDREQIAWQVPGIASGLATKKAPAKAEQLYQQLFGIVQGWSVDNLQPLLNVAQGYPRFLMSQKDRQADVPDAIERYRKILITARGTGTGYLQDPLQITIEFERFHGSEKRALLAAQDLLALEESLNGSTSEPYLQAVETLADLYQAGGDPDRTLRLLRQAVAIGDLVYSANDARRGNTRTRLAFGLARQQQFDDAERMAVEAVAIGQQMRPPQTEQFTRQLEQIRKMKVAKPVKPASVMAGK